MMRISLALLVVSCAMAQTQLQRGEKLFLDPEKGCASCHQVKDKGTAVGPDLAGMAKISPQVVTMGVRSSLTQYVVKAKPKTGDTFPAIPGPKDATSVQLWDLSKKPPELKKFAKDEITFVNNDVWKHPPYLTKISNVDLADIVYYLRATLANVKTPVKPEDVQ